MKKYSSAGFISLVVLPIAILKAQVGNTPLYSANLALLYYKNQGFFNTETSTFSTSWLSKDGIYGVYFGTDFWYMGLLIVIGSIIGFYMSITQTKGITPELLLIVLSSLLLFLRNVRLESSDLSFYVESTTFGVKFVYWEFPLAAIAGLFFALLQFIRGQDEKK